MRQLEIDNFCGASSVDDDAVQLIYRSSVDFQGQVTTVFKV